MLSPCSKTMTSLYSKHCWAIGRPTTDVRPSASPIISLLIPGRTLEISGNALYKLCIDGNRSKYYAIHTISLSNAMLGSLSRLVLPWHPFVSLPSHPPPDLFTSTPLLFLALPPLQFLYLPPLHFLWQSQPGGQFVGVMSARVSCCDIVRITRPWPIHLL